MPTKRRQTFGKTKTEILYYFDWNKLFNIILTWKLAKVIRKKIFLVLILNLYKTDIGFFTYCLSKAHSKANEKAERVD